MKCDFLVVGSGIAGLSFAIKAARLGKVIVLTKKKELDCATNLAQGGIAAVISEDDSFDLHIQDTLKAGDGLCDKDVVRMVVENGPDRIRDLIALGVNFNQSEDGKRLNLGKEGGHSKRRVAHSQDLTGREIERALLEEAKNNSNISIFEDKKCIDLILDKGNENDDRKCIGAYVLDGEYIHTYISRFTILCTGGVGKVYLYTSNPDIATGDGVAMAFRAGAKIANMEFVQFHPTCLYHHEAKNFLISEAVRGEGAYLLNKKGERFMENYHPDMMELATRDKVSRAIDEEMKVSGEDCVYLDISHKDANFIKTRFPNIYKKCLDLGIDITQRPIPVVPAAHYLCGGVLTDTFGKTSITGLLALGETACTGLHGGNRLASNSLLEAIVYADKAFEYCETVFNNFSLKNSNEVDDWKSDKVVDLDEEILINHNWDLIRRIMWNYVGIVRSKRRLRLASNRISEIVKEIEQHYVDYKVSANMIELRNIAIIANLIIDSALLRDSSIGLHYMKDAVEGGDRKAHWNILQRSNMETDIPWKSEIVETKTV